MRKLAALVVLAAGIGFPCVATAAEVVDIMCQLVRQGDNQPALNVVFSQAYEYEPPNGPATSVEVPPSCRIAIGSPPCAQCQVDLLSQGFSMRVLASRLPYDVSIYTFTK